ncbi:MAG: hypothetical protein J6A95_02095 [Clostridia bacterium]|nr:hypothetical protein [Clostridia bacterium]
MNKKRKFTFNVIDALIILILVAIITFIVYYFVLGKDFNFNNENSTSTETIKITEQSTINNTSVSMAYLDNINIGKGLL